MTRERVRESEDASELRSGVTDTDNEHGTRTSTFTSTSTGTSTRTGSEMLKFLTRERVGESEDAPEVVIKAQQGFKWESSLVRKWKMERSFCKNWIRCPCLNLFLSMKMK